MTFREANIDDRALIYDLAVPAWEAAYAEILSGEQIKYMLKKMYSAESLKRQMDAGHRFFIAYTGKPVGFISLNPKAANHYILEKLYVLPDEHGTGAGRFLVEKAEEYIRNRHPGQTVLIELNVNRNNKAVGFYKRMGFHIDRLTDEDIGNGFYKNDYIMQKTVE
jgi:GNAT superfamily N-acetyltransferase